MTHLKALPTSGYKLLRFLNNRSIFYKEKKALAFNQIGTAISLSVNDWFSSITIVNDDITIVNDDLKWHYNL